VRVLRGGGTVDDPAHSRASDHDGAVPRRHRKEKLHPEERVEGVSELARARRGREAQRQGGRVRALPAGRRCAIARLARQPELDHAPRLDLADTEARSPGPVRVRSRSLRGGSAVAAHGRAGGARAARRIRAAVVREDLGLEGIPHPDPARRRGRRRERVAVRARRGRGAGQAPPAHPDARVHQGRPCRSHLRRHRAQRAGRDVCGGLRGSCQAGRAHLCAVHVGRARGRHRRPAHVHAAHDGGAHRGSGRALVRHGRSAVLAARGDGEASNDVDRRGLERGAGGVDAPAGVAKGTAQAEPGTCT